jgi:hypothetical protein
VYGSDREEDERAEPDPEEEDFGQSGKVLSQVSGQTRLRTRSPIP